jgi:hypothetical protein
LNVRYTSRSSVEFRDTDVRKKEIEICSNEAHSQCNKGIENKRCTK